MTKATRRLASEVAAFNEANRKLRAALEQFENANAGLAQRVQGGDRLVDALKGVGAPEPRLEINEALEEFEVARHRVRVAMFARAIEDGTSMSEVGRALGVSRQLSARLGAEARKL